jgi:hypothetical protein
MRRSPPWRVGSERPTKASLRAVHSMLSALGARRRRCASRQPRPSRRTARSRGEARSARPPSAALCLWQPPPAAASPTLRARRSVAGHGADKPPRLSMQTRCGRPARGPSDCMSGPRRWEGLPAALRGPLGPVSGAVYLIDGTARASAALGLGPGDDGAPGPRRSSQAPGARAPGALVLHEGICVNDLGFGSRPLIWPVLANRSTSRAG